MPIYEYQCGKCQHAFELIQKISDDPVKHCDQCGADEVVRLVSAPGFQLKGTGWYVTDFKDQKKKTESSTATKTTETSNKSNATPSEPVKTETTKAATTTSSGSAE